MWLPSLPGICVPEHGYCHSFYTVDSNGLILEFTRDHPEIERINEARRATADQDLARWLAGDHAPNNV